VLLWILADSSLPAIYSDYSKVVIASGLAADSDLHGAIDDGANGYVLKAANTGELVLAIQPVAEGLAYFSPDVQHVFLAGGAKPTEREYKVLRLAYDGLTDLEIARRLSISRTTERRALDALYDKLGIGEGSRKRATLFKHAAERGWL
jgi:DNA-binding NarL/FixJ family response regulator